MRGGLDTRKSVLVAIAAVAVLAVAPLSVLLWPKKPMYDCKILYLYRRSCIRRHGSGTDRKDPGLEA